MYLRFVSPLRTDMRGVNLGIFHSAGRCRRNLNNPDFLRTAIQEEFDWFNKNLPHPGWLAFGVKSRKRWIDVGICWFKSDAREMIQHAFALRALVYECGMVIKPIGTDNPGQILYSDEFQIVAKPRKSTPTAWG